MASWEIPEQKNGGFKWENHLSLLCYWRESFSHWNLGSWDWSDIVWIQLTGPGGLKRLGTLGTKLLKSLWFPRMPLSQLGWFGYLMVSVAFSNVFKKTSTISKKSTTTPISSFFHLFTISWSQNFFQSPLGSLNFDLQGGTPKREPSWLCSLGGDW